MDILFAKGLGLVKKKKDPELDKFLRPKKADMVWNQFLTWFILFQFQVKGNFSWKSDEKIVVELLKTVALQEWESLK